jgi:hypothetical protein
MKKQSFGDLVAQSASTRFYSFYAPLIEEDVEGILLSCLNPEQYRLGAAVVAWALSEEKRMPQTEQAWRDRKVLYPMAVTTSGIRPDIILVDKNFKLQLVLEIKLDAKISHPQGLFVCEICEECKHSESECACQLCWYRHQALHNPKGTWAEDFAEKEPSDPDPKFVLLHTKPDHSKTSCVDAKWRKCSYAGLAQRLRKAQKKLSTSGDPYHELSVLIQVLTVEDFIPEGLINAVVDADTLAHLEKLQPPAGRRPLLLPAATLVIASAIATTCEQIVASSLHNSLPGGWSIVEDDKSWAFRTWKDDYVYVGIYAARRQTRKRKVTYPQSTAPSGVVITSGKANALFKYLGEECALHPSIDATSPYWHNELNLGRKTKNWSVAYFNPVIVLGAPLDKQVEDRVCLLLRAVDVALGKM